MDLNSYFFADEAHIKREKAKVREAKKSRWWQQKTASGRCHYCGRVVPHAELTLDHIVPISRGGRTTPGNCVPCCRECNRSKGCDTPVDLYFKTTSSSSDE